MDGNQSVHTSGNTCNCENCGGTHHGAWGHPQVRVALIGALAALALWGVVEAATGIQAFRYIGSGIAPTNTISISGSGKIFAVPDTATFSFTIIETGKDVGTAQTKVATKMDAIISYLTSAGIEERDVKTVGYNAYPKYDEKACVVGSPCPSSREIIGYEVSESVTVKVRDTEEAGAVLSNVGDRGVSNVSGLSFTVDDEELLTREAREKAIADAQGKAEALAQDLGVSLIRVVGYYDNGGTPSPMYAYGRGGAEDAKLSQVANVQVGENEIIANVTITYEIR